MQRRGAYALGLQVAGDPIGADLGAHEDQHRAVGVLADEPRQVVDLVAGLDLLHGVGDGAGRALAAADLHVVRIALHLAGQLDDLVGHRRREEQGLAVLGQRLEDALDVGPEAHVEHAVALVEDQRLHAQEIARAVPHVVHQPARASRRRCRRRP